MLPRNYRRGTRMTYRPQYRAPAEPDAEYLTPPQAADYLGLTDAAIWKAIGRGHLPTTSQAMVSSRMIRRADLDKYRATRKGPGYRVRRAPMPAPPPPIEHYEVERPFPMNGWRAKCSCGWRGGKFYLHAQEAYRRG